MTTQSKVGSTTSSANNRAIVVFNAAFADKSPEKESVTDIVLKLEKDDVEGGMEGISMKKESRQTITRKALLYHN